MMAKNNKKNLDGKDNTCSIRLILYIALVALIVMAIFLTCHYNNKVMEVTNRYQTTLDSLSHIPNKIMVYIPDSMYLDSHAKRDFIDDLLRYMDGKYAARIDQVISSSDARFSREMNYMNLWVTIWVGLIGLAGVLFPLVLGSLERRKWSREEAKLREELEEATESVKLQKEDMIGMFSDFSKRLPQRVKNEIEKDRGLIGIKKNIGDIHAILPIITLLTIVKDLNNYSPGAFSVPDKVEAIHQAMENMCKGLKEVCTYLGDHVEKCSTPHYYFLILALELSCQQINVIFTKRSLLNEWRNIQGIITQLKRTFDKEESDDDILAGFNELYIHLKVLAKEIDKLR